MKDLKTKIEVMQAALDGEEIQYNVGGNDWHNTTGEDSKNLSWDWYKHDYRIKPKPREWFMNVMNMSVAGCPNKERSYVEDGKHKGWETIKVREVLDENI